ncbi:MAG: hypothetical protein AAF288_11910 [Planctomycetota bacterium]
MTNAFGCRETWKIRAFTSLFALAVCGVGCQSEPPGVTPTTIHAETLDPDVVFLAGYDIESHKPPLIDFRHLARNQNAWCGPSEEPQPWPASQPPPAIVIRNLGSQPVTLSQQNTDWSDILQPGQTDNFGHRPGLVVGDAVIRFNTQSMTVYNAGEDFLTLQLPHTLTRHGLTADFGQNAAIYFQRGRPVFLKTYDLLFAVR